MCAMNVRPFYSIYSNIVAAFSDVELLGFYELQWRILCVIFKFIYFSKKRCIIKNKKET
jgi:hypothetical protein